jgi:hypothetical protein
MTTPFESVRAAREIIAGLRDIPADVLSACIEADMSLSVAAALLLEGRTIMPYDEQGDFERVARSGR